MNRGDYYRLTIHYWPEAVKHDLRPVQAPNGFGEWQPNWYRPHSFDFDYPPTRDDFEIVIKCLPWAHGADWLPVIQANDWPLIQGGFKAASVDLTDEGGRVVGRLESSRQDVWANRPTIVPFVSVYAIDRITSRLRGWKRDAARKLIRELENRIRERVMASGDLSEKRVEYEIRRVIHEAGILKTKPKVPVCN